MLVTRRVLNNNVYTFTNGILMYHLECSSKSEAIDWYFEVLNRNDFKMLYITKEGDLKEVDLKAARRRRKQV